MQSYMMIMRLSAAKADLYHAFEAYLSDYRKSLPSDFIRIRLKIEQNYRLFWDIFFSAIMNDLFMTFISRLKVDVKCVYQQ